MDRVAACIQTGCLWAGSIVLITQGLLMPQPAKAELTGQALVVKVCVNGLLYRDIYRDGTPSGTRTIIGQNDAAIACQGVGSLPQALTIKRCVNGLLYTQIYDDGTPAGSATGFDARNAAIACTVYPKNRYPRPTL
jgi:hypothetical protein